MLRRQVTVATEGAVAFAAWAGGDAGGGDRVLESEQRGEEAKRRLLEALRDAFVTPVEPEDLFALSRGLDRTLDRMKDVVNESRVMATAPDPGLARMAEALLEALRKIEEAAAALGEDRDRAEQAANEAIRAERGMEHTYLAGMGELLELDERGERIARRELYRGCARIGETIVETAERIVYAVIKQN
jgi:uncharacterized protein Yka (UPF0111/DUF47 family)